MTTDESVETMKVGVKYSSLGRKMTMMYAVIGFIVIVLHVPVAWYLAYILISQPSPVLCPPGSTPCVYQVETNGKTNDSSKPK